MGAVGGAFLLFARRRLRRMGPWLADPAPVQEETLRYLVRRAADTAWGRAHDLGEVRTVSDYQQRVPLAEYPDFEPWWRRALEGERDVTWPGRIRDFAVTSGTTGGNKLIPVSDEAVRSHRRGGRDALFFYVAGTGDTRLFRGRMLFLGGSTDLRQMSSGARAGDLSGIMARHIPSYLAPFYSPGPDIALMRNWEEKLECIARRAVSEDIRAVCGIPSWMVVLFQRLLELSGRNTIAEIWPNLSLVVQGGLNCAPYKATFDELIGKAVPTLEVYPSSEGFIAVQDDLARPDLLLMADYGIFYEFVPVEELGDPSPTRLTVADVETDTEYAVVLSTNAGIFSYVLGDTVRFTGLRPHRLRVTGRTEQFLSAFGEHLSVEDAEVAVTRAAEATGAEITDYTAAPLYPERDEKPAHQWLIEFRSAPADLGRFAAALDGALQENNEDYAAHREGGAGMRLPLVVAVPPGTFYETMKRRGRLGGQNKVPRLSNSRELPDLVLEVAAEVGESH